MKIIRIIAVLSLLFLVMSCDRDQCEPPFSMGMGLGGVFREGPIEAGKKFSITFGMWTKSISSLEDIEINVKLPPEVSIEPMKELDPGIQVLAEGAKWKGNLRLSSKTERMLVAAGLKSSEKRFGILLKSNTDWEKWSHPIEISVRLYQEGDGSCFTFPDGYYGKTITWSHKGYNDAGWTERPERK